MPFFFLFFFLDTECKVTSCSDSFTDTVLSVEEDMQSIMDKLNTIITKLDKEILKLCSEEASTVDAALQETGDPEASEQLEDDINHLNSHAPLEFDSENKRGVEDSTHSKPSPESEHVSDSRCSVSDTSDVEETEKETGVRGQGSDNEDCVSTERQTDFMEEKNENDKRKEETNEEWITVG